MDNFDVPFSHYDREDDQTITTRKDTRKTRLTLRQIHLLRQMNDIRGVEYKEKLKLVRQQYAPPAAPPGL